jgi:hypothetical protein
MNNGNTKRNQKPRKQSGYDPGGAKSSCEKGTQGIIETHARRRHGFSERRIQGSGWVHLRRR